MILLTRLDNSKVLVNLDNVKFIEATPDTVITFVNGDSMLVKEPLTAISDLALNFKSRILENTPSLHSPSHNII